MNKIMARNISVAAACGLLLGWIISSYDFASFFRTSAWSLLPWGLVGIGVALLAKNKKEMWLLSLIYSEVLTISFTISGAQNIHTIGQLSLLVVFGILSGLVGAVAIGVATSVIRLYWPPAAASTK